MKNIGIFGALLIFTSCLDFSVTDYMATFDSEVINNADADVIIKAHLVGDYVGDTKIVIPTGSKSKIFAMSFVGAKYDLESNNLLLRGDGWVSIKFYTSLTSEKPFKTYSYVYQKCRSSTDLNAWKNSAIPDEDFLYGETPESVTEALFVISDSRPFYLERDENNPDLGRLIITAVPQP